MKLDVAAQGKILGALAMGADVEIASRLVPCSRQAIYNLRKRSPGFAIEMDHARHLADEKVVRSLYRQARSGNVTACIFWLKNRIPGVWRDRHDVEVNDRRDGIYRSKFADGEPVSPAIATKLPDGACA